ncbi:MAG: transcriptional regulator [Bacteroidetes bacterium]|jgi:ATP-dependent DNA helicase RecG|nr:transcriptional regulator [Bacteroidota bacterium]MBT6685213.1 transcriptional regulator [Bacteroidota bacterium]MBT7143911.1 transcriptional regulator [Bacteroidota bacterium]MBT7493444.1 transcriptional regulator [Bacteroidota bacterium]
MRNEELIKLLEELVAHPIETQWIEFKMGAGSITNEQIGEYVSAMSNGATISNQPFGYLVWGVDDDTHEVKGTNFCFTTAKQGNQDLELWVRNLLHPKINFEIFEFAYHGNNVVMLRIPSAKGEPTHFKKKPFIRIGSNKTDLRNFPEYVRIIYNSLEDWSTKIIDSASIPDLDTDAIAVAREKFKEKSSKAKYYNEIDNWDTQTFLDKAKVTINGKITNAAILLLGKEEASHYLLPSIAEITWKLETEEKAYEHFSCPLLLNTSQVLKNIRNIKYKFFPDNELLATTVDKYDTRTILEAMHNCIAHQDYSLNRRIIVTEKIDKLIFANAGSFFEGNPDDYSAGDKTPDKYRNPWLAQAMVNLGMIDTLGYGIHTMYLSQKNRYFPLPDYLLSESQKVILQIYGHSIDENYSKLLIERKDLSLSNVVLLDRVQKKLDITKEAAVSLRKEGLIEGRNPNYFVSASVAEATGQEVDYIKMRGIDDDYIQKVITDYLKKFKEGKRQNFESVLLEKLPDILSIEQKRTKIKNNLQALRKKGIIEINGKIWKMSKNG